MRVPGVGLVMEGGAMRGMFTAGVIDVWMENEIDFEAAVGVSAGATFGCNYKSRQIGRAVRYNKRFAGDKRYCSVRNLIKTGDLFGVEFCYHELPGKLDVFDTETFRENPMDFYVVATDVNTGKAYYHKCYDGKDADLEWIRASASIPMLSRIVQINGGKYLDGGIADSIPVRYMESIGFARNVLILTRPASYRRPQGEFLGPAKLMLHKYPNMIDAMTTRADRYNDTLEYIERAQRAGIAFVVRPEEGTPLNNMERDPEKLEALYQAGRKAGEAAIPALRRWLEDKE